MTHTDHVLLHRDAPEKPPSGAPCNGCGVCCALLPCPLSRTLLGHREGSCPALIWHTGGYRCGLVIDPAAYLDWLPCRAAPLAARLAKRWIAAGMGCDCDAEID